MNALQKSFKSYNLDDLDEIVNKFAEENKVIATQSYAYTDKEGFPVHVRILFYFSDVIKQQQDNFNKL